MDELAGELRRRLIERRRAQAAAGAANLRPLPEAVRDLVDEDAAILEPFTRERLREIVRGAVSQPAPAAGEDNHPRTLTAGASG